MSRRRRPLRGALLGLVAALTAAPLALAAPPAVATPTTAADDVHVELTDVGPPALTPGGTLTVRADVRNDSGQPLTDATVDLRIRRDRSASRSSLQRWVDGDSTRGRVVATRPAPAALPSGSAGAVEFVVPADSLGLSTSPTLWGPRGLSLHVVDRSGRELAQTRSFVVWQPPGHVFEPTLVSVLVPLTAGPPDISSGRLPASSLADLTADDGRLRAVLGAASQRGVTWALDPAVLEDDTTADGAGATAGAGAAGATATPTTDPAADTAEQWRTELVDAARGHEVVTLAYGDPDVTALAHAGQQRTYSLALRHGTDAVQRLFGQRSRDDVAWPVSGTLDEATLAMLVGTGSAAVVLSGGAQPPVERLNTTPTGRSRLDAGTDSAAGLLVDTPLSATLALVDRSKTDGKTDGETNAEADAGPAAAVQRLLAETAAITLERPFDQRHVLVAAPRDWDPEPATGVAAVQALTQVPWVQASPLSELVDADPADVERGALQYPAADRAAELPSSGLEQAADTLASVVTVSSVLAEPGPVVDDAERSVVAAASVAWRDHRAEWRSQLADFAATATQNAQPVKVLPGSPVNVVSARVDLPITLANALQQEVTVGVRLRPRSSRLVVGDPVQVTIPAGAQQRVFIPVRAVANGNTDVAIEVLTPAGDALGPPVTISVRVRADWESRGTLVLGVLVGLVLVAGLARSIHRGRRRRAEPLPGSRP